MLSERNVVYEARVGVGLSKIQARSGRRCRGIQAHKSSVHCGDGQVAKIGVETQRLCMNKFQAGRAQLVNDPGLSVRCDALSRAGGGLTTRAYSCVVGGGERSSKVASLVRYLRVWPCSLRALANKLLAALAVHNSRASAHISPSKRQPQLAAQPVVGLRTLDQLPRAVRPTQIAGSDISTLIIMYLGDLL